MQQKELRAHNQPQRPARKALFSPGEVKDALGCLQQSYREGGLSRKRYENMCKGLRFTDEYGRIWSIGHQTGAWYYNFDFQWHPGEPHSMLARMESGSQACLHCGEQSPSRSAVYCIICGKPLASLPDASSIVPDTGPAPRPARRLRRNVAIICLLLALLAAAVLLYMYVNGTALYAGLADSLLPLAPASYVIAANRRRSGT